MKTIPVVSRFLLRTPLILFTDLLQMRHNRVIDAVSKMVFVAAKLANGETQDIYSGASAWVRMN